MRPSPAAAPARILVELRHRTLAAVDPVDALVALQRMLGGEREAYLLESLPDPVVGPQSATVGFGPLVRVSVRSGRVDLSGCTGLVEYVGSRLLDAGVVAGSDLELADRHGLWDLARTVQRLFQVPDASPHRFDFGFLAVIGYEALRYLEDFPGRPAPGGDTSGDVEFTLYQGIVTLDRATGRADLVVAASTQWDDLDVDVVAEHLARSGTGGATGSAPCQPVPVPRSVRHGTDRDGYLAGVRTCLDHIALGDVYQVQIGHQLSVETPLAPLDAYRRLRSRNPSPYMALLPSSDVTIIAASPELFVRVDGGRVTMKPIAGTAVRTDDALIDVQKIEELRRNEKETAEHVMLVDLCRNDLGRIAAPCTVRVHDMMDVETYSHVFHLVTSVTAHPSPGVDVYDVVSAAFPAGTMTGAPKIRATEIIDSVEADGRGFYAGAFGLIGFGGFADLGLCIRALVHRDGRYTLRASAGVVADSEPLAEWRETLAKMNATYWAVTGAELL